MSDDEQKRDFSGLDLVPGKRDRWHSYSLSAIRWRQHKCWKLFRSSGNRRNQHTHHTPRHAQPADIIKLSSIQLIRLLRLTATLKMIPLKSIFSLKPGSLLTLCHSYSAEVSDHAGFMNSSPNRKTPQPVIPGPVSPGINNASR